MSDLPSQGGNDFFANMIADLLRMFPSGGGPQWAIAYQMSMSAAQGDEADPNPDPRERIRFEELTAIAELHVADVTGMRLSPSGRTPQMIPTSRAEWARRTLDSWRPILDRLSDPTRSDPTQTDKAPLGDDDDLEDGDDGRLAELFSRWAEAMTPMMMALQVGSAAGHLAARALGQYEVPLAPAKDDEILVVSSNLSKTAEDWSLASDDLSLWLSAHELAHHAVLSRPHVARRLADLVVAHAKEVQPDPGALEGLFGGEMPGDMSSILDALGDASPFLSASDSGEAARLRAELDALTAAISGYAEHVTATVATRLIGNEGRIVEAMRRRRLGRGTGETMAEQLFGLRLDQEQVDRGARFVQGVLERSGDAELARLWVDEASLPTVAEIDAPGLWLARLGLKL